MRPEHRVQLTTMQEACCGARGRGDEKVATRYNYANVVLPAFATAPNPEPSFSPWASLRSTSYRAGARSRQDPALRRRIFCRWAVMMASRAFDRKLGHDGAVFSCRMPRKTLRIAAL